MNDIILGVAANVLRAYAIYRFMELLHDSKPVTGYVKLFVYSLFIVLTSGGYYLLHNQTVNLVTNLVGFLLISMLYLGSKTKKVVLIFCIYAINVVMESLVFSITGLYEEYDEMTRSIKECITSLGIYFSILLLERTTFKKERQLPMKTSIWMMMMCVPAFSVIEIFFMWHTNHSNKLYVSLEIIGVLVINIAIFYLYDALQDYYRQKSEREEFRIAMESYSNQIDIMQDSWQKIRSMRHDLKHHICELKYLTVHQEKEQVITYLQEMECQIVNEGEYVSSGIKEIDGTLNYLLQYARNILDEVEILITVPEDMSIHSFTLNVLLGNLLDNAIRASHQSERKYLSISIKVKQDVLYIQIVNSYKDVIYTTGKKLLTTKKNKQIHGIGLENVEKIIKEQGGEMEIKWDEKLFYANVILFLENLKKPNGRNDGSN